MQTLLKGTKVDSEAVSIMLGTIKLNPMHPCANE